jgi:hypothetical protein
METRTEKYKTAASKYQHILVYSCKNFEITILILLRKIKLRKRKLPPNINQVSEVVDYFEQLLLYNFKE